MTKRSLSLLLALSLWLGSPAPAVAATPVAVDYNRDSQTLVMQMPSGVVPDIQELANPPRFVVELPATEPAKPQDYVYGAGLVSRYTVSHVGDRTRAVLQLRQPLNGAWTVNMQDGHLVFRLAPRVTAPAATPRPVATPTPRATPRPTPRPTPTARPTPKPTPKATPTPAPRPTPLPTPKAIATAVPTPAPTATATPAPVATPSPLPTPLATPMPTPEPRVTPVPLQPSPLPTPATTPPPSPTPSPTATPTPRPTPTPTLEQRLNIRPAKPARGNYARVSAPVYDEASRVLTVPVSSRVTPQFAMQPSPPRLVMDIPGSVVSATQHKAYDRALVTEVLAYQLTPTSTRVVMHFARPVGSAWVLKQTAGKLILMFDRNPLPAPKPTPKPTPKATPKPAPKPTPKPTATPAPRPTPAPTTRPAPKASPTAKPVPKSHGLTGTVFNVNTGEPLAGVLIRVAGKIGYTNGAGQFEFTNMPVGLYDVTVSAPGFATQEFKVKIPDDKTLSLNLVPALD